MALVKPTVFNVLAVTAIVGYVGYKMAKPVFPVLDVGKSKAPGRITTRVVPSR